MMRVLLYCMSALVLIGMWAVLVFAAISGGWLKSPIVDSNSPKSFAEAARGVVDGSHTGNLSMYLIENGRVAEGVFRSSGEAVDGSSVYQVASLGKWITAWGVMTLVEDGTIDLDSPVSNYLTRWTLPSGDFDPDGVTVRRLLSHTAGLDDALGYDGFESAASVQSLEESLSRARDASPGKDGVVKVGMQPGAEWKYSGGGYTMLQLIIEEMSGQDFAEFMAVRVFGPLGMTRTTFRYSEAMELGLAENFSLDGRTEPFRWYSALAATSLFTTADDLVTFMSAQSSAGEQSVLSDEMLRLMRKPHATQMGAEIWGLGVMLFAPNNHGGYVIGHDGNNEPAINTVARYDPDTGDGIVILSTGSETLATRLAGEWIFWKTGNVDSLMFLMSLGLMLRVIAGGSLVILVLVGFFGFTRRH
ncbi:serine hydrolase domain-containing protein [Congregibacter sp.]|uniref:serine hydrolase domain-containing protein n=1 Tax=Congregibacter sp. TaxID=2744308 RepID=UPI003859F245